MSDFSKAEKHHIQELVNALVQQHYAASNTFSSYRTPQEVLDSIMQNDVLAYGYGSRMRKSKYFDPEPAVWRRGTRRSEEARTRILEMVRVAGKLAAKEIAKQAAAHIQDNVEGNLVISIGNFFGNHDEPGVKIIDGRE